MYSSIGKLQPSIEYTHSFIIFSFLEQLLIHHNAYACGGTSEPQAITILMLVQINFSTCTLAQVHSQVVKVVLEVVVTQQCALKASV